MYGDFFRLDFQRFACAHAVFYDKKKRNPKTLWQRMKRREAAESHEMKRYDKYFSEQRAFKKIRTGKLLNCKMFNIPFINSVFYEIFLYKSFKGLIHSSENMFSESSATRTLPRLRIEVMYATYSEPELPYLNTFHSVHIIIFVY